MPKTPLLLSRVIRALARVGCLLRLHAWTPMEDNPSQHYCSREGCKVARNRTREGWKTYIRSEVTEEQVRKLNRHERRRLGALAQRGAFGNLPQE